MPILSSYSLGLRILSPLVQTILCDLSLVHPESILYQHDFVDSECSISRLDVRCFKPMPLFHHLLHLYERLVLLLVQLLNLCKMLIPITFSRPDGPRRYGSRCIL